MIPVRTFLSLNQEDRGLLAKAFFIVVGVRLGLWLLPFHTLRRLIGVVSHRRGKHCEVNPVKVMKVKWAVIATSRFVPEASCLTQALATKILLNRIGQPTQLHIGVAKGENGQLQAHAWVEIRGRIVIGLVTDLARYTTLPSIKEDL